MPTASAAKSQSAPPPIAAPIAKSRPVRPAISSHVRRWVEKRVAVMFMWESPVRLIDDDQPKVSPARFVGGRRARAMVAVLTSSARSGIVPLGTRDGTDQDGATTGGASGDTSASAASAAW